MIRKGLTLSIMLLSLGGCDAEKEEENSNGLFGDDSGSTSGPALYGPENQWHHTTADMVPNPTTCGTAEGDVACNFTLQDQNGDDVELYQFSGQVIVLDVFTEW